MKAEIPIKVTVMRPPPGVTMMVQRGRDELLPPSAGSTSDTAVFDLTISVDLSNSAPNFLGKYTQGPKGERFIYVNSGQAAGQFSSCWSRRAKISLMSISREQIETVLQNGASHLYTQFEGVGRDGGPTCASVKGIEWRVG